MILKKNIQGYTLIEVIITVAIFTVMMQTVATTMMMSQRSLDVYTQKTAPRQALRMALATMVKELREAQNVFIDTRQRQGPDDHSIILSFQRPDLGDISYSWNDAGEDANKIIRTNYSQKSVLAYNITSLSFTSPNTNEVIITMGDGNIKGTELLLTQKVALRMQTGMFAESQNETIK